MLRRATRPPRGHGTLSVLSLDSVEASTQISPELLNLPEVPPGV